MLTEYETVYADSKVQRLRCESLHLCIIPSRTLWQCRQLIAVYVRGKERIKLQTKSPEWSSWTSQQQFLPRCKRCTSDIT